MEITSKQLQMMETYALELASCDQTGHGKEHIRRVAELTKAIAKTVPCNASLALAIAYLHDTYDEKLTLDVAKDRFALIDFLQEMGMPLETQQFLLDVIDHFSFSAQLDTPYQLPLEGQIAQDADRLDALGAIGIGRAFYYGGVKSHHMGKSISNASAQSKAAYRQNTSVIQHFYDKLLLLEEQMHTAYGKELAAERTTFLKVFLAAYEKQDLFQG